MNLASPPLMHGFDPVPARVGLSTRAAWHSLIEAAGPWCAAGAARPRRAAVGRRGLPGGPPPV